MSDKDDDHYEHLMPIIRELCEVIEEQQKALEFYTKECEVCGYELAGGDGAPSGYIPYDEQWKRAHEALDSTTKRLEQLAGLEREGKGE